MPRPLIQFLRTLAQALAALAFATVTSTTFAAAMTGTYRLDSPQGPITATIEVHGGRLTGSIDFFGKSTAALDGNLQGENSASGSVSSGQGSGAFAAALHDDTLELTLFQAKGSKPATPPLVLRRIVASGEHAIAPDAVIDIGDKRLIGSWTYRDEFFSEEDSSARNEYLELHADGTYVLGRSGDMQDGAGESTRAAKAHKPESGRWRAEDGVLYFMVNRGVDWMPVGRYLLKADGRSMRISYERGNRKLWTRQ